MKNIFQRFIFWFLFLTLVLGQFQSVSQDNFTYKATEDTLKYATEKEFKYDFKYVYEQKYSYDTISGLDLKINPTLEFAPLSPERECAICIN